jgi:hypothetical protein
MTKAEFIKQERDASRAFMDRFSIADFQSPAGSVGYSREYRCDCGFRTESPEVIYDHTCDEPKP